MQPFTYARAVDPADAYTGVPQRTALLAGGTELLNWMRLGIEHPAHLLDISHLSGLKTIDTLDNSAGLRIGALATLNEIAEHPRIVNDYPVLAQACLKAASAQLRNLASIGGNLLQRTRCPYFRSLDALPCNKRTPGSGCAARHGINDKHAIFGWTDDCVAVQPSDPAVALAALDAEVVIASARGIRRVAADNFHTLPADELQRHNVLADDELITAIELHAAAPRSAYLKVRERESYEFALVSAAAAVELDGETIRTARIALGSVALRPWRLKEAERRLQGVSISALDIVRAAIEHEFQSARALPHNASKIVIAQNAALRALQLAAKQANGGMA
ncbi:xanthine dehydrogenase family protein subunit M [Trinickia sp. LjRoot230]|uniref:FAD binding domain-containing protein n=1 Tax=Trinickia sp. LjRoot230 TaxID=3342288 RepID=UPI003ECE27DF